MAENTLSEGDIVRLKSGGSLMTVQVNRADDLGYLVCSWFVGTELKQGNFSPESLTRDQDKNGPSIISSGAGGVFIG